MLGGLPVALVRLVTTPNNESKVQFLFTIDLVVKVSKVGATSRKTEKHGLREPGFLAHVGGVVKMVIIRQPALMIPSPSVAKNLAILLLSVHNSWVAR